MDGGTKTGALGIKKQVGGGGKQTVVSINRNSLGGRQVQPGVLVLHLRHDVCKVELTLADDVRGTNGDCGKWNSPNGGGHLAESHNHRITGPLVVSVHYERRADTNRDHKHYNPPHTLRPRTFWSAQIFDTVNGAIYRVLGQQAVAAPLPQHPLRTRCTATTIIPLQTRALAPKLLRGAQRTDPRQLHSTWRIGR